MTTLTKIAATVAAAALALVGLASCNRDASDCRSLAADQPVILAAGNGVTPPIPRVYVPPPPPRVYVPPPPRPVPVAPRPAAPRPAAPKPFQPKPVQPRPASPYVPTTTPVYHPSIPWYMPWLWLDSDRRDDARTCR